MGHGEEGTRIGGKRVEREEKKTFSFGEAIVLFPIKAEWRQPSPEGRGREGRGGGKWQHSPMRAQRQRRCTKPF
jgi:hypothetical protein